MKEHGFVICKDCGFEYDRDIVENVRAHMKRHNRAIEATENEGLNFIIEYEKERGRAWNILTEANSIDERVNAAIQIIRCHFSRSVMNTNVKYDYLFTEYIRAYLYNLKNHRNIFNCDIVLDELINIFGIEKGKLYPVYTQWGYVPK